MKYFSRVVLLGLFLGVLAGCASVKDRINLAQKLANSGNFQALDIDGGQFVLRTYYRFDKPGAPLKVYIEGDGVAWLSRTRISPDPTPDDPIAFRLALEDTSANVIYIARPCQFVGTQVNPVCRNNAYWTGSRFAPEVIDSVSRVVDTAKAKARAKWVDLVGFSGGGAVAVLVASRRTDVESIRTVSGNLDHVILNRRKGVSPLSGSLNAADVAAKVSNIPQIHFIGTEDRIIGPYVAQSYLRRAGPTNCISIRQIRGASHGGGWAQKWRNLLAIPLPKC